MSGLNVGSSVFSTYLTDTNYTDCIHGICELWQVLM